MEIDREEAFSCTRRLKGADDMATSNEKTRLFPVDRETIRQAEIRRAIRQAAKALRDRGYQATDQIVGYIMSGDPAFITSHNGARYQIRRVDPDELLAAMVAHFFKDDAVARWPDDMHQSL